MRARKQKQFIWWLLAALLLLAAVLTYFVLKPAEKKSASAPTQQIQNQMDVLQTPGPNASDDEKKKYADLVASVAKDTTVVEIQQCLATPQVSRIKINVPLTLKNKDSQEHAIVLGQNQTY